MTTHGWRTQSSMRDWLLAEPYRFEFVQAIRLLEQFALSEASAPSAITPLAVGSDPCREAFRLRSHVGFDFSPSEVRSVVPSQESHGRSELTANLYALAGASTPLPDWVAELLQVQARNRDYALRDFLDLFHHRILSLLYRVQMHHRPWLELVAVSPTNKAGSTSPSNRMAQYVLSFAGLGISELQHRLSLSDWELLPYAGLLWQRPRSMLGLERILAHALKVPVASRPMLGVWNRIEPEDRTRLGTRISSTRRLRRSAGRNHALGYTSVLGSRTWNPQGRFDIILGPLKLDIFTELLPGGSAHRRLKGLVRFYAGDLLEVRTHLRLNPGSLPPNRLGHSRLGWTSWFKTKQPRQVNTVVLHNL